MPVKISHTFITQRLLWLSVWCQDGWIRDDASDYDLLASLFKDPKWSYHAFLPYYRKVENHHIRQVDVNEQ